MNIAVVDNIRKGRGLSWIKILAKVREDFICISL